METIFLAVQNLYPCPNFCLDFSATLPGDAGGEDDGLEEGEEGAQDEDQGKRSYNLQAS